LVIKLVLPAEPADVTKFTLIVAADALMLVAVNLSMMAVTPVAVYWVVWAFSANFAGTRTFTDTVTIMPFQNVLKF
jgi:ligand-binding SRPBCC domain-containing protein